MATSPTFDLQSHSRCSDGELAPAEVVAAAADAGVELLALTDHDSVSGVAEAAAAASDHAIGFVPGVEISVIDSAVGDLHLLGYLIDPGDGPLMAQLERSRTERESRAARMVSRLEALGWAVDGRPLAQRASAGLAIGRPHLAEAVLAHPENQLRLAREGLSDPSAFLVAYLIEGRPGFLPREAPSVEDAIALIQGAGGVAVWAHPFWDVDADAAVLATLDRFCGLGLDGVEAFYITHTREQTTLLARRADDLGLLSTGSADFHGPSHRQFHAFRAFETFGLPVQLGAIANCR